MKRNLLLLLLAAAVTLTCHAQHISYNGAKQDVVIDVRTPAEFAAGHIDGARNIPLEQLQTDTRAISGIPKENRILLYCRSGRRSAEAQGLLKKQGYLYVRDGGGMTTLKQNIKTCASDYYC